MCDPELTRHHFINLYIFYQEIHPETVNRPHLSISSNRIIINPKKLPYSPRQPCSLKQINVFRQNSYLLSLESSGDVLS